MCKLLNGLIIAILVLLSIAAGLAKVLQSPHEVEFLQGAGMNLTLIIVFGLIQISGGLLLVPSRTRLVGAPLIAATLILSMVLIFMAGDLAFSWFSIIPIVLTGVIIYRFVKAPGAL